MIRRRLGLTRLPGIVLRELAGLRVKGSERIAEFSALINLGRESLAGAFAVNKITPLMLNEAPYKETVMPKFLEFIQNSCLCCYNANLI